MINALPNQFSRCPSCLRIQSTDELKCAFCGNPFHKLNESDQSKAPLLSTASNYSAYKIDTRTKIIFAVLFFCVAPVIQSLQNLTHDAIPLPISLQMGLVCVVLGFISGCLSSMSGYSAIFTAGSAGVIGGFLRLLASACLSSTSVSVALQSALPIYGIYAVGALAGGGLASVYGHFAKKQRERNIELAKSEAAYVTYKGKRVSIHEAANMMKTAAQCVPAKNMVAKPAPSILEHVDKKNQENAGPNAVLTNQPCSFQFFLNESKLIRAEGQMIYQTDLNNRVEIGVRINKMEESDVEAFLIMMIERQCGNEKKNGT